MSERAGEETDVSTAPARVEPPAQQPPSRRPMTAAEANRAYYAEAAERYDATEECIADARLRRRLLTALERVVAALPNDARALDACGGSGNASLMLLELGVTPVTVDLSPEMLGIYERKARKLGYEPRIEITDIDAFLMREEPPWNLIVFSSALHHLDDYERTLELAVRRLAPGGMILTMFDPTRVGRVGRRLRRLDYVLHVLMKTPRRVPGIVRRRLRSRRGDVPQAPTAGDLAERHALGGIDDDALRETFRSFGLKVVTHTRYYEGRFAITRLAYRLLREPSAFHFIVARAASELETT